MPFRPFDPGAGGGGSGGTSAGGGEILGVLLRQSGEVDKGLFFTADGIGLDGHGVGQSSTGTTPANGGHVDLPNNGGGVGVNRNGHLRLSFPADISGYEGEDSNNIVVRLNRLDAVAASPVIAWDASTGIFTLTVGRTTEFSTVVTAISNFSTFTITTAVISPALGSDRFQLGGADATGTDYSVSGGHDEIPPQIELLAEPSATPPRILVKYDPSVHTTLQGIFAELEENDQGVDIIVPHGTDLDAAPEGVPWDRRVNAGVDDGGSGTGTGGVIIQDEGTSLSTTATAIDFTGAGVEATGSGTTKIVNIPGGSAPTDLAGLPIPAWTSGNDYAAWVLVRDAHGRIFVTAAAVTNSRTSPAQDSNFNAVDGYEGDYADRTAYPRGAIVTHSTNVYFVNAAVGATNTDDPASNNSFVQINGGGSGGISGIEVKDEGTALTTDATGLNFTGDGVTATGNGAEKVVNIPGGIDGVTVQNSGTSLTTEATTLNFDGAGVTATGNGAVKTITIPGGGTGTGSFDLHDNVSTAAAALNADGLDRFLISQESETGDPNAYITAENARKFFKSYVGAWEDTPAGFVFRVGDITEYNDQWYVCRAENTKPANGPDTDPTHWEPVTSFAGVWTTGNWWHQGTIVTHSTHVWLALEDVVDTDAAPGTSSKWVQIDGSTGGTGTPPNPVVLFADTSAPSHAADTWRAVTLSRVPQTSSQISIRLTAGSDRGTVSLVEFPAREWLDLPVIDNTGSGGASTPASTLATGERVLGMVVTQVGDTSIEAINTRNIVICRYSDTSMGMWHTTTGTDNALVRIVEFPNAGQTVDISAARTDTLVFHSPTSGHAAFDALDFGSTVTIAYGSSETDAKVLSASRSGTLCTLVLEPSDGWATAFSQATFELQDSSDVVVSTLTVSSRANARADVSDPGEWYADLEALTGGEEVWRDIARIDTEDNTHLSLGTRTATTVPINSSTGDPVTLPASSTTEAGVHSAADKTQQAALPATWVGARVWPAGVHCAYQGNTYRATTQREITDTDPPTTDPAWVDVGAGGVTNLAVATTATQVTVESDTGTNAVISPATDAAAGAYPASAHERVEASIDKWADGAHTVGQQRVWNETAYVCIADTSPGDDNPATDTTGWAPLGNTPDLSGYVEDSDIANFRTQTQITSQIATAVSDRLIDGGAYDATDAYAAGVVVRHNSATYLSLIAVGANTGATTEPGVGTAWETSWFRVGFEDGPPNAFISAALAGENLTFTREGGTNPLTVDIGGVSSSGSTLRVESIGMSVDDIPTSNRVTVPEQDWIKVPNLDAASVVEYGAGAAEIIARDMTDASILTISPGVYQIEISCFVTAPNDRAAPVFEFRDSSDGTVYGQSELAYIRNRTSDSGGSSDRGVTYDSDDDGTDDLGVALVRMHMMWVQTEQRTIEVYAGSDPWIDNTSSGFTVGTRSGMEYVILPESLNIRFMRPGSGNPVVNNVFAPQDIGTDTFDLDGTAQTALALVDDTSGEAIVIPDSGYILTNITATGLDLQGVVQLHFAEDLQNAARNPDLTAQFYTNSDNELLLSLATQSGAVNGNKVIVQRVGATTETTSGGAPVISPSILRFDVTGENHPSQADISGDVFDIVGEISQSGHVGHADIVGFAGTAHDPTTVSTLLSDTQVQANGGYHHFTGRLTIPASTMLAAVGNIYTIRLRVWPTGGDTSTAPTIYHDYRITRVAPAAVTHFGHMPFIRSGTTHTDASDLTAFTDDISTAGSAIGEWTVSGLVEGDGERRLYWAVPASDTQPTVWINDGSTVTDIIDVPSMAQDIGGVSYRVYVTNRQFDDFANGITYTTRSS